MGIVTGGCVVDEGSDDGGGSNNGPPPASPALAIQPVLQRTQVWFSSVYPQCVADCSQCPYTMGPMSHLKLLIDQYGPSSRSVGAQSRDLSSALILRALTQEE